MTLVPLLRNERSLAGQVHRTGKVRVMPSQDEPLLRPIVAVQRIEVRLSRLLDQSPVRGLQAPLGPLLSPPLPRTTITQRRHHQHPDQYRSDEYGVGPRHGREAMTGAREPAAMTGPARLAAVKQSRTFWWAFGVVMALYVGFDLYVMLGGWTP